MQWLPPSLIVLAGTFAAVSLFPMGLFDVEYDRNAPIEKATVAAKTKTEEEVKAAVPDTRPVVKHVPLPAQVKTIYMTSCVAGTTDFRQRLVKLAQETEINSIIIDIKDFSGTISFPPESEAWKPAWNAARCGTAQMKELVQMLHENDIYVIGRITVFQDPFYAPKHPDQAVQRSDRSTVWTDHKGLSFVDVASEMYWDHILELATESYNLGFDELNFDYVRYPSDGNMTDIWFPQSMAGQYGGDKQANLEAFFKYLNDKLDEEERFAAVRHENTGRASSTPYTSADLFGMTTTNFDDLSIGQVQDRAAPYFDFIAPMVYPSHYPKSFLGLGNPNDYPYKVVYHAMKTGAD
ncbi:MAG TPA: putative glycoside hydrolase, partial [Candidatus Paceibacterota bacterium]